MYYNSEGVSFFWGKISFSQIPPAKRETQPREMHLEIFKRIDPTVELFSQAAHFGLRAVSLVGGGAAQQSR